MLIHNSVFIFCHIKYLSVLTQIVKMLNWQQTYFDQFSLMAYLPHWVYYFYCGWDTSYVEYRFPFMFNIQSHCSYAGIQGDFCEWRTEFFTYGKLSWLGSNSPVIVIPGFLNFHPSLSKSNCMPFDFEYNCFKLCE